MFKNKDMHLKLVEFEMFCLKLLSEKTKLICYDCVDSKQATIAALYCRILEQFNSCLVLGEQELFSSIPILGRAMCESYMDLKAMISNPDYFEYIAYNTMKELIKQLNEAKKYPDNPFAKMLLKKDDVEGLTAEIELQLAKVKKTSKKMSDRFDTGEVRDEYLLYMLLCSHIHGDLTTLASRHIEERPDGFHVRFLHDYINKESFWPLIYIIGMTIEASETIHTYFNTDYEFKSLKDQLDNILMETIN